MTLNDIETRQPRHTNQFLIETFGRETVKEVCADKIRELLSEYDLLKASYKKKKEYLEIRKLDEKSFWYWYVELTTGEDLRKLAKELKRLSHLYLLAADKLPKPKGKLSDDDIQRAREHPIADLYDGKLVRCGRDFKALCPFHKEKSPSFYLYTETNKYHCYGCQKHGDPINYLMELKGYKFPEAVKELI